MIKLFSKNTSNPDVHPQFLSILPKNGTRRDLNRVSSDNKISTTVSIGLAAYIKYVGVLVIEAKARASKMASAHPQDGANARDFEGDMSLYNKHPKRVAPILAP